MICPKCKADIPDDSWFCDQCGCELMFCPKCKYPAKGKRCTQCGSELVTGKELGLFASQPATAASTTQVPNSSQQQNNTTTNIDYNDVLKNNISAQPQPRQQAQPSGSSTLRGSSDSAGGVDAGPSRLVMLDDPSKVVVFKDNGIIGRTNGDYLDVFSNLPYVSGTHAKFTLHSSKQWLIADLGSTNGTKLQNTDLIPNSNYLLKKGQIIEIGFVKFRVE